MASKLEELLAIVYKGDYRNRRATLYVKARGEIFEWHGTDTGQKWLHNILPFSLERAPSLFNRCLTGPTATRIPKSIHGSIERIL
jgi:hypothetical protein